MSITSHHLAIVLFATMFAWILWGPITWLLLSIFTPKSLLEKYFKEPHFTLTETYIMRGWPGFLLRTGIFSWSLLLPSFGKKRQIKETWKYMPRWYAIALKIFMCGTMMTLFIIATFMPIVLLFDF
ncbi:hypothetical protein [Motiliproteus sp. MSK22-1]|uniref:hypothetical protein n=1 Tax=Motiliproteus sp. MSK22-1 TaxID=1897630 RepID=UPI0009756B47|nr:hypothetical protein [Motiliproteus sp. MSK22-1]OMH32079.1 hypothetical protein BGP75_15335 [Motiliproteus sp. MSK22-1]